MADFDSATLAGTTAPSPATGPRAAGRTALEIRPTFCPTEVDSPFDTTEWELRTAAIKGEDGKYTMPPRAGNSRLSDQQIQRAADYMVASVEYLRLQNEAGAAAR